jgi:mono/diheme cytochrome c family protein
MMSAFRRAHFRTAPSVVIAVALLAALAGCRATHSGVSQSHQHLDFNQDVQPILASNCFACHGPDPEMRKANLRLDLEESAFKKRPGKPDAIVPGHPERSELIRRIESKDPHYLMPQSAQNEAKPMKPAEIAILKQWVAEGAHYRPHWAFEKPVRAAVPQVQAAGWQKNPIDAFILRRLANEGLHPSPEADRHTLIRRVTLDLTGLLPTPEEVNHFVQDSSPQAYEHVVDRLLASPAFGEQRARYWLDYARYADTYGLHFDNNRYIWAYRDYLIKAFNTNKPFDQFAKEQIAGDLLPPRNLDQIIASGWVRSGVSSNEGGTIPEELRVNIARERTEAYGAAFLGLTVGCAVCHDHKYDPTTQKDFYQLSAFFNNINEQPFNGDKPNWAPVVRIPKPRNMEAYNRILEKRAELQQQLDTSRMQHRELIQHWLTSKQTPPQPVSTDMLQLRLRLDEGGGEVLKNSAPNANPQSFPIGKFKPQWGETTWLWPDFRMDTSTRVDLGQMGDFEWDQPFSSGGWFMLRSAPNFTSSKVSGALISKMDATQHDRGWVLAADNGIISVELADQAPKEQPAPDKPKKDKSKKDESRKDAKKVEAPKVVIPKDTTPMRAIKVSAVKPLPTNGQWDHLFFTYDGSGKAAGVKLYENGEPVATKTISDTLARKTMRTAAPLQLGRKSPDEQPARDTRYQDIRLYARSLTTEEAKRLPFEDYVAEITSRPASQWNRDQWHAVTEFYFANVDESAKATESQIQKLDSELDKLSEGGPVSLVAEEKPSVAYADVLTRGIYTARKERVEANTPHFLPPLPAGVPHNRLALADWTVSPENPLTARVTVNRMWNELFGAGLVETTEDFGIMGQRPSHPQLLDWLAVEFRESGWDMKHMYKLMVMSAAYRQSAKATPGQLARDPKNLLLAHGPRFRMDAEMLRDIALQSSGLLVNKIGGPSVKPYQPENVWESVGYPTSDTTKYKQDHGDALYRRSLYTYWKRMAMPPNMDAFDAPTRDTACTRRQRTDTPLQALVTMNDPQWVEASRALAERLIRQGGKQPEQRIQYLSELVLSHDPSPQMASVLQQSLNQMEQHYATDPAAAHDLVAVGEKPRDAAIPAPELAAWTMVVSEVLNLDESLNK